MIDPSITGRVGLAGPSGNTERRNGEDGSGWKSEICEEKGESKKKREVKADP